MVHLLNSPRPWSHRSIATVATRRWTGRLRTLVAAAWFGLGIAGGAANAAVILVAEDDGDFVHRLDQNGVRVSGFALGVDFDSGDGFAVGRIDGDDTLAFLVVEDDGDFVAVHKVGDFGIEVVRTFQLSVDFDSGDGFAVGDVNGDGKAEILVLEDDGDFVDILDQGGKPIPGFPRITLDTDFDRGDGFAVGDFDGDGKAEILVVEDDGDAVEVLDARTGTRESGFRLQDVDFDSGDALAVGDFDGDGSPEILVVEDDGDAVEVLDARTGTRESGFRLQDVDFDSGDGFAVIF